MPLPYLHELPIRVMRLELEVRTPWKAKNHWAADARGALGKALKGSGQYKRLFEPALPASAPRGLGGGQGAPRPFVIHGPWPRALPEGGVMELSLVLLGRSAAELEGWTSSAKRAFADGMGDPRGSFRLRRRELGRDRTLGAWAERRADELLGAGPRGLLQVSTATPVRLLSDGELLVPSPPALADGLLRRLQAQALLHGLAEGEVDWSSWVERARAVEVSAGYAEDWWEHGGARYSFRQRRSVPLDGLVGWWRGFVDRDLAELFAAGELLHAGKATTSGLGRLLVSAPLDPPGALVPPPSGPAEG